MDLVTHDIKKFFKLLLTRNGHILEQVFSPLTAATLPEFKELKMIAAQCISREHGFHFLGFGERMWKSIFIKNHRTTKNLLYMFRVLLVGCHLMKTGQVESNLPNLNLEHRLSYLDELMERKRNGSETGLAPAKDFDFYDREYRRLRGLLFQAMEDSRLPEHPTGAAQLNDLLIRLRLDAAS